MLQTDQDYLFGRRPFISWLKANRPYEQHFGIEFALRLPLRRTLRGQIENQVKRGHSDNRRLLRLPPLVVTDFSSSISRMPLSNLHPLRDVILAHGVGEKCRQWLTHQRHRLLSRWRAWKPHSSTGRLPSRQVLASGNKQRHLSLQGRKRNRYFQQYTPWQPSRDH